MPPSPFSALPPVISTQRCTSMHFDENQLSPSLISLSLLSTTHPRFFQQPLVRTSTRFYSCFILVMDSSLGFGSAAYDLIALFTLAFALAPPQKGLTSPYTATRRTIMQKVRSHTFPFGHSASTACKRMISGTISLSFSEYFSPFPHGTCSLSVTN